MTFKFFEASTFEASISANMKFKQRNVLLCGSTASLHDIRSDAGGKENRLLQKHAYMYMT